MTKSIEILKSGPTDHSLLTTPELEKLLVEYEDNLVQYNENNQTYLNTSNGLKIVQKELGKRKLFKALTLAAATKKIEHKLG
jgi:hypothetical protein